MKLSVIGAGYVGLTTAACLAQIGHDVFCSESDINKLAKLQNGIMPLFEPHLENIIETTRKSGRLRFGCTEEAIDWGRAIFICVGTPPLANGDADLCAIEGVARMIAKRASGYRLVIEKSTVPVQTGSQLGRHLSVHSTTRLDYDVASNPEFLREGSAVEDFLHPDRIVVGVDSVRAEELLREIYEPIIRQNFLCPVHSDCPRIKDPIFLTTDTSSAELIKHASNSFLALKISYINAISVLCELCGGNVQEVANGMGMDTRIGRKFLDASLGFGGSCFPKDLSAFIHISETLGYNFGLLKEVQRINALQMDRFVHKIIDTLWVVKGKSLGILGLAFKQNTDDIRMSPAIQLCQRLQKEGALLRVHDPQAMEKARAVLTEVTYVDNMDEVADGCDALVIATEWPAFKKLDLERARKALSHPIIFDGRNLFDAAEMERLGFLYKSIGRK